MADQELRAYIESATPTPGSEYFVVFPDNPKQLERFYDIKTKAIYVFSGTDWIKENNQSIEVMESIYARPDEVMVIPSKKPARTPQGEALEQAKKMQREMEARMASDRMHMEAQQAAKAEIQRRLNEDDYMRRMQAEYNEVRIKMPWLTAGEAAEYLKRKYNP